MVAIDLTKPGRRIQAGVILMNGVTEVLDVAPIDFFPGLASQFISEFPPDVFPEEYKKQAQDFDIHWVNEKGGPARLTSGMTIQATDSFETCPPLDIVLMGAHNMGYTPSETELAYVRKAYDECSYFLTICAGMQPPLLAGLLHGKTATAPKPMLGMLRSNFTDVDWVEKRWSRDGKLWTSGTLLNGLDMMREFVTQIWGKDSLAGCLLDVGGFPKRDVDFRDA